jgi:hypothetical protein
LLEAFLNPQRYASARPYLYHLTHQVNLAHLRELGRLVPAAILMERAGRAELIQTRRKAHERVIVHGREIVLRDQRPLHKGNAKLSRGLTFEGLVETLNRRVFFWPGNDSGPIGYGVRHFQHYEHEHPIILRVEFESLLRANPSANPLFCHYNSGSPRCSYGKKSPRGTTTFVSAADFGGTPSQVVEVTFENEIILPPNTMFATRLSGPWEPLLNGSK